MAATSLLGSRVRLRNEKEGECVSVVQSPQGFGLVLTLLLPDGSLQDAHSGEVVFVALRNGRPETDPTHGSEQARRK